MRSFSSFRPAGGAARGDGEGAGSSVDIALVVSLVYGENGDNAGMWEAVLRSSELELKMFFIGVEVVMSRRFSSHCGFIFFVGWDAWRN